MTAAAGAARVGSSGHQEGTIVGTFTTSVLVLCALSLPGPATAQAATKGRFETLFTVSVGEFQHGNPYDEWGSAVQLAVTQAFWGALFAEAEWSRAEARWPPRDPLAVGSEPTVPAYGLTQTYLATGLGLQWPTRSILRPYAGVGSGRMTHKNGDVVSSKSIYTGVSLIVWTRVRARFEYRRRREWHGETWTGSQWLAGVSVLLAGEG